MLPTLQYFSVELPTHTIEIVVYTERAYSADVKTSVKINRFNLNQLNMLYLCVFYDLYDTYLLSIIISSNKRLRSAKARRAECLKLAFAVKS